MKTILLSPIGTRGDVQPMLALALQLRALGVESKFCVPPNYVNWVQSFDFRCVGVGQDVQVGLDIVSSESNADWKTKRQRMRSLLEMMRTEMIEQFRVVGREASDCSLIVGSSAQSAGGSIAEKLGIPYVYVVNSPSILPSADHPPPSTRSQTLPKWMNVGLWWLGKSLMNRGILTAFNEQRVALGLSKVKSVVSAQHTDHPWLAAEPLLAPLPRVKGMRITQTGYWFLPDTKPLPDELEKFLSAGTPPIFFGFGSMPARSVAETRHLLIEAASAVGRRAIIAQQHSEDLIKATADFIEIGATAHEQLFPRVAAVVHHGGAGTTTAALCAGIPQVVAASFLDQHYWAHRVRQLKIGAVCLAPAHLTKESLVLALRECLQPEMSPRIRELATNIELNGARQAAEILVEQFSLRD